MSKEKPKLNKAESGAKSKKELLYQAKSEKEIGSMSEKVKQKWELLRQGGTLFNYLGPGIGLGVPKEVLDAHAAEVIKKLEDQKSFFEALEAYKLLKKFSIRNYTDSDIEKIAGDLYEMALADYNYNAEAMDIAKEMWGRDSEEYRKAKKATIEKIKKVPEKIDAMAQRVKEIDLKISQLHTKYFQSGQELTAAEKLKVDKELPLERERLINILSASGIPSVESYLSDKNWVKGVEETQKRDEGNREKFRKGEMAEDKYRYILMQRIVFSDQLTEFERIINEEPKGFYGKFKKWLLKDRGISNSGSLEESEEVKLMEEYKESG